jgi:hypothetical protein
VEFTSNKVSYSRETNSPMKILEIQKQFVEGLTTSFHGGWDKIEIHYENFVWTEGRSEKYRASRFIGDQVNDIDLGIELIEILEDLQKESGTNQNQQWNWLEFNIDNSGRYQFNYHYGVPPLIAEEIASEEKDS